MTRAQQYFVLPEVLLSVMDDCCNTSFVDRSILRNSNAAETSASFRLDCNPVPCIAFPFSVGVFAWTLTNFMLPELDSNDDIVWSIDAD